MRQGFFGRIALPAKRNPQGRRTSMTGSIGTDGETLRQGGDGGRVLRAAVLSGLRWFLGSRHVTEAERCAERLFVLLADGPRLSDKTVMVAYGGMSRRAWGTTTTRTRRSAGDTDPNSRAQG